MENKVLTPEEIKRIQSMSVAKRELNAETIIQQLLGHIAATTPKPKKDNGD